MTVTTLRSLREEVARGFGVRTFVEGSTPTLGTGSILPDWSRLEPDGEFDGIDAFILFTSGSNDGVVRRVTGFSTGNSLQFGPSLSAAVPSGQSYQVFKTYHPTEDYNVAINDALAELGARRVVRVGTTSEVTDQRRLAVPSAIANAGAIVKIERSVGTTGSPWQYEELFEGYHFRFVRSTPTAGDVQQWLELMYPPVQDTIIRFTYESEVPRLVADTDATYESAALIKALARKYLDLARGNADGAKVWSEQAALLRAQQPPAEQARTLVVPRIQVY